MKILTLVPATLALVALSGSALPSDMPAPPDGAVNFVSGGIGEEERAAMQQSDASYNLKLVFAEKGTGAYLAGVRVSIRSDGKPPLLGTVSNGPWLYAQLPAGKYRVSTEFEKVKMERDITVGASGMVKLHFYWP